MCFSLLCYVCIRGEHFVFHHRVVLSEKGRVMFFISPNYIYVRRECFVLISQLHMQCSHLLTAYGFVVYIFELGVGGKRGQECVGRGVGRG